MIIGMGWSIKYIGYCLRALLMETTLISLKFCDIQVLKLCISFRVWAYLGKVQDPG